MNQNHTKRIKSDDSTSGSDNNYAMLQNNKGRIPVESDEEEDKEENEARDPWWRTWNRNNTCGEELIQK